MTSPGSTEVKHPSGLYFDQSLVGPSQRSNPGREETTSGREGMP